MIDHHERKKSNILLHINLYFFQDLNHFICHKKKHLQLGMKNAVSQWRENKYRSEFANHS